MTKPLDPLRRARAQALEPEPDSALKLTEYLKTVRRHWRLIAVCCALSLTVFVARYSITPKEYRATTQIQIERRSLGNLTGGDSSTNPWLESYWSLEYYPTQYRLLESRGLAERVIKNLRLTEDPAFNPSYRSTDAPPTADGDDRVLGVLALNLLGGLEVLPVQKTQMVEISYVSSDPTLSARVANGFAEAFIDWGIETRSTTAGKATTFLGSQIEKLKQEISDKEAEIQAYSRSSDIVTLDPASNVTLQRLEALNKDYIATVSDRISKEAKYNELLTGQKETVADTLSGGLVGQLRSEQLDLEREYATKLNTFKPEWPAMLELKAKIDKGRQHLDGVVEETLSKARQNARTDYQTTLRQEQALADEISNLKEQNLRQNSAAVGYNNLRVEISTRRSLLDELMRKQSETEVTARLQGSRESNVHVVDRALVPSGPFRPSLRQNLLLGLMLGLILGVGAAFLIEYMDRTIKSAEDLERLLGLPTLAVIPDISEAGVGSGYGYGYGARVRTSKKPRGRWLERRQASEPVKIELLPHVRPRLPVSEAYRSLRTALLLSSAEELKVVTVTSAETGEGKTTTATNLAVVLAQLGHSVLLIDADLRKPRLHHVFGVSNRLGLVNCLTGGLAAEEACQRVEVPDLYLLPSGPIPPNPAELLASQRMRDLLDQVRRRFEFVVADTPPSLAVADATIVGSISDGVLLCLRAGKVLREDARACRDRLLLSELKILGTVLNRYQSTRDRYGKGYHYYEAYAESVAASTSDSAA